VSDVKVVLLMMGLHVIALGAAATLIVFAVRGGEASEDPPLTGDDGFGGIRRPGPPPARGGPPLADARQARLRLRGPGRLADVYRLRRVRAAEPHPPRPSPVRERQG